MVRTRNKQDSEVDFAGRILSLDVRKSRRSASHSLKANGERRRVFSERRSFLSRLRPRSGQRKPYNYAYEDTSDEDSRRKVKPQTLLCDLSPDISKAPSYQSPARRHQSTLKIQPLGFTVHPVSKTSLLRDRARSGTSIADVEPMGIDKTVTFSSVGGLGEHIKALKEMVVFPLLYPEFYEHFKVVPSRGVLFHGPPGTGKTLLARALANECSQGSQKVAFFMRKGADCLCKWVGEAERQLRLLFEKAYEMRPSIIFFDEIDGLAPVRSSRQDQIHSSIVSTLLALMDGIDCRGEIVVIGATNRIDAIDPALRRPGRFDKEFQFLLPNHDERMRMLKIHTANWNPALSDDFVYQLAERCSGYCGADIKGLVTDATQNALRRHYPQIYATSDKLQIDISSIKLSVRDFARAMSALVPAAQRAATNPSIPLDASLRPLLGRVVERARLLLVQRFPFAASQKPVSEKGGAGEVISDLASDEDEDDGTPCIFASDTSDDVLLSTTARCGVASFFKLKSFLPSGHQAIFRPRMLLSGPGGFGQTTHVAPAILNLMDHVPVHTLDSTTLFAASARIPEEACANVFHEAKRTAPSVIYMPHVQGLWAVLNDLLRVTMMTLVRSMYPSTPVLILATSETPFAHMDRQLRSLFSCSEGEVVQMENFTADERQKYFSDLILNQTARPPPTHRRAAVNILKPLRKASREQRQLTEKEARKLLEREEDALRELRIFLRDILSKLGRERKFSIFTKPVDIEEALDYYNIIKMPMDLSTVMANIDLHKYTTAAAFLDDIFLICSNALEYNPDRGPTDRAIRHRACALRDMAQALLKAELDPAFEELCQEIHVSRKCRGVDSSKMAPSFCHMGPLVYDICASLPVISSSSRPRVVPDGTRYSRRVRGLDVDNQIPDVMQCAESGKEAFRPPSATDASPGHLVMSASRLTDACSPIGKAFKHCHSSPDGELVAEDGCLLCPGSVTNHITSCTCPTDDESFQVIGLRSTGSRKSLYRQCPLDRPERRRSRRCAFKCVGGSAVCSNFVSGIRSEPCEHCRQPKQSADCQHASQQRPESPCSAANPANVNPSVSGRAARCVDVGVARPATNTAGHCSPVDSFGREEDIAGRISPCSPSRDDVLSDEDLRCERKREISNEASNVVDNCVDSLDIAGHPPGYVDGAECFDVIDNNNSNTARKTVVLGHQQTSDALKSEFVTGTDCTPASGLDALRQSAVDVLKDEELVPMVVDRKRLERLLDSLVGRTVKFNVESLQRLHTAITATIHKHRHCHDKTDLVQELERTVDNACPQTPV